MKLFLPLACLVALACAHHAPAASPANRPNIIVILGDDMGWQALVPRCHGGCRSFRRDTL